MNLFNKPSLVSTMVQVLSALLYQVLFQVLFQVLSRYWRQSNEQNTFPFLVSYHLSCLVPKKVSLKIQCYKNIGNSITIPRFY
jgi:hypothetical protein